MFGNTTPRLRLMILIRQSTITVRDC
ncbi:hypothetical protein LINGRAHAP2_LOCUS7423 [Linum grandiflorum]